jgi:hypothetical protein
MRKGAVFTAPFQNGLAEFALRTARIIQIIFCRGVYVAKNTFRFSKCQRRAANRNLFWQKNRKIFRQLTPPPRRAS